MLLPAPFLAGLEWGPFAEALVLTLKLALTTTAILLAFGVPLAHWLNASRMPGISLVQTLVGLPVVLPPTVIGFYLLVTFSPAYPPGSWWREWTGGPLSFSFTGLVVGSVIYSLPYAVQPFQAALGGVPARSWRRRRRREPSRGGPSGG